MSKKKDNNIIDIREYNHAPLTGSEELLMMMQSMTTISDEDQNMIEFDRRREYTKVFSCIFVEDIAIRKQRATKFLRQIYKDRALFTADIVRKLAILFEDISLFTSDEYPNVEFDAEPPAALRDFYSWYCDFIQNRFVIDKSGYDNRLTSETIYEAMDRINRLMRNAYKRNDVQMILHAGTALDLIAVNMWQLLDHVFGGLK